MTIRPLLAAFAAVPALGTTPQVNHPQPNVAPAYPPGAIPAHGALVHLKGDTCAQRASVTVRVQTAGGKGLVLVSDAPSTHWLASVPPTPPALAATFSGGTTQDLTNAPIPGGYWLRLSFATPGSYSFAFASDACRYGSGLYVGTATVLRVTATR